MGLLVWSSIGYGDDDNSASSSRTEPTNAPPRSPIRRRSPPMRNGSIRDPVTGTRRVFRRPLVRPTSNSTDRFRVLHLEQPLNANNEPRRTQSRSPLVPAIPTELRNAFDEAISLIRDSEDAALSLEQSATTLPRSIRNGASLAAVDRAIAAGRDLVRDLSTWRSTVENWERMAQRGEWTARLTPSTLVSRLSNIRMTITDTTNQVVGAFHQASELQLAYMQRRTSRQASSLEIHSPSPERSPQPSVTLDVQPLSPSLEDPARAAPSLPPLRRMGRRSIIDEPVTTPPVPFVSVPTPPLGGSRSLASGLGDRTRSVSPDNEGDAWDTMLMTIEPDATLPTAESSFTSTAASTSFSAGDNSTRPSSISGGSFRTHITVPSVDDAGCDSEEELPDLVDEEGNPVSGPPYARTRHDSAHRMPRVRSTATSTSFSPGDASEFVRAYYQSQSRTAVHDHPPAQLSYVRTRTSPETRVSSFIDHLPRSESPAALDAPAAGRSAEMPAEIWYSHLSSTHPRNFHRVSNFHDGPLSPSSTVAPDTLSRVVDGLIERRSRPTPRIDTSTDPLADPEFEHMRSILERMAQSGDIPDEWWASAGLTPILASGANGSFGANTTPRAGSGSTARDLRDPRDRFF